MAYTTPNTGLIRPWNRRKNRYVHRKATLTVVGTTASATISVPGPGRLVAIQYGKQSTGPEVYAAATSGVLTIKAESTNGVQIFTDGDLTSVQDGPVPVGTTAVDEGRAATAATDGFSGGFPIREGVFVAISSGTATEVIVVDMLFRLCTYAKVALHPTGSAGSATDTVTVDLGNAGVLAALAIDFGASVPATADVTIFADDATAGTALFTSTNSATDLAPSLLGAPGKDEAINATAATDGTECGNMFKRKLIVKIAQGDPFTTAGNDTTLELWIDD